MASVVLGDMCRLNFGIINNYDDSLRTEYKEHIDLLNKQMISIVYGTDRSACIITKTYDIITEEADYYINNQDEDRYIVLENALKYFCKIHDCSLKIHRKQDAIEVTIDMLSKYDVIYI